MYMGGTGPYRPLRVIFCSDMQSWYTSLNIEFRANRKFHVLKTPVYRFDLDGRYRKCGPMWPFFNTNHPMANRSLFAKLEVRSFLSLDAIMITTDEQTDIVEMS